MYQVKIDKIAYPGQNQTIHYSYKAHIEYEVGAWIEEAPARDSYEQAQDDAHLFCIFPSYNLSMRRRMHGETRNG